MGDTEQASNAEGERECEGEGVNEKQWKTNVEEEKS